MSSSAGTPTGWGISAQADLLLRLASTVTASPPAFFAVEFDAGECVVRWRPEAVDEVLSRRLAVLLSDLGRYGPAAFDDDSRLPGARFRSIRVRGRTAEIEVQADVVLSTSLDLLDQEDPIAIALSIADWAADGRGVTAADGSRSFSLQEPGKTG